ncbi:hypothetical protein BC940DRAFT_306701 [Gongronella butleri]|nr:hypothetical protein BC940DRAFT_306701 [Gongronella butleri]
MDRRSARAPSFCPSLCFACFFFFSIEKLWSGVLLALVGQLVLGIWVVPGFGQKRKKNKK